MNINVNRNKSIFCKTLKGFHNQNDINIELSDICNLLDQKGRLIGFSNIIKADELYNNILENISIKDIEKATHIHIIFTLNEKQSMFPISDILEHIHQVSTNDCEMIFSTITTGSVEVDIIDYKIFLSGL